MKLVRTVCPYCGVGCGMIVKVRDERIISVYPERSHPSNAGTLCIKGWKGVRYVGHPDRLKKPLIRKGGRLVEASWGEALRTAAQGLGNALREWGPESIMIVGSAKCTNEANFLIQKFARAVIGTNNVDHCARLCHAPTVKAMFRMLGSGAMTNPISDIDLAEAYFVIGSNTTEQHPIIGARIIRNLDGKELIVADPRKIRLARLADVHLRHRPGSDIPLLNSIAHVVVEEGLVDWEYVGRSEGFEKLRRELERWDPGRTQGITGVPPRLVEEAAEIVAEKRTMFFFAMGITQHETGTQNVAAVVNLAVITGNVGKPGAGINPLRGQNNVQGATDLAVVPEFYPGYATLDDPRIGEFEEVWGTSLPREMGVMLSEAFERAKQGEIRAMYIMGENPAVSDPNSNLVRMALEDLEFLIVQDIFPTETSEYADVVLPAASWAEEDGTITSTDRRVQRVRAFINPPGEAMPDWWIITQLARTMGADWEYNGPWDVLSEINRLVPQYRGITWERLEGGHGIHWPCPSVDHPGTPRLHEGRFVRGKALLIPPRWKPPSAWRDEEYPLIMTTGRTYFHWHTRTMTRRVAVLQREVPEPYVEVSPEDAETYGIRDGSRVVLESRHGRIEVRARVSNIVPRGVVFVPFHFAEAAANALVGEEKDPESGIPAYKVVAVRIGGVAP